MHWIPKATNTYSEYVIHIAFPLQQWLHERASMLCYTCIARLVSNLFFAILPIIGFVAVVKCFNKFYVHVTVHRDMWPCIVTCDRTSWHVAVHRDMWPYIVTCDRASWHVTVHRDMWPYIVTCDRTSWHVAVHRDMWPYIVTCGRTSW
jgi:hypothetical protein